MKKTALTGYLMVLLSAIGFGSYGVWSKYIGADFGVFFQGWVRSALVLSFLIPIAYFTKSFHPIKKKDLKWILIPVIFGIATQAPLYYAYTHMDIGSVTLVFYSLFLIASYIVGKIILNEKLTIPKFISMGLAFIGLFLVYGFSIARFSFLAFFLAAMNGLASGAEVSTSKKPTNTHSSLEVSIYIWAGILLTHLPLSILFGERQIMPSFNFEWFAMGMFALAGLVSFWLVIEGYKYIDASIGGLIGLLEIIAGIVFGIMLFGERLSGSIIAGSILIILAAAFPDLVTIFKRKKAKAILGS